MTSKECWTRAYVQHLLIIQNKQKYCIVHKWQYFPLFFIAVVYSHLNSYLNSNFFHSTLFFFSLLVSFFIYLFFRYFLKHKTKIFYIVILCYKKQYSLFSVFILYTQKEILFAQYSHDHNIVKELKEKQKKSKEKKKTTNCLYFLRYGWKIFPLSSSFISCFRYAWLVSFLIFKIKTSKSLQVNCCSLKHKLQLCFVICEKLYKKKKIL